MFRLTGWFQTHLFLSSKLIWTPQKGSITLYRSLTHGSVHTGFCKTFKSLSNITGNVHIEYHREDSGCGLVAAMLWGVCAVLRLCFLLSSPPQCSRPWFIYLGQILDDQTLVDSKPAGQLEHASLNHCQLIATNRPKLVLWAPPAGGGDKVSQ